MGGGNSCKGVTNQQRMKKREMVNDSNLRKHNHQNMEEPIKDHRPERTQKSLPHERNLSDYTKVAEDFIKRNEFKKLARKNNLNLNGKLI